MEWLFGNLPERDPARRSQPWQTRRSTERLSSLIAAAEHDRFGRRMTEGFGGRPDINQIPR